MIESITLENWKTHKQSTLHFGKGTNVLVGVIGSGKSSVMDGLCYGLFGTFPAVQNRRVGISDLLMRKPVQADTAKVNVQFSVGEKKFRVERILKRNGINEGRLWLNNTLIAGPKPNQVTERIEKELQVTYELFTRAVYSEQNNVDYFLKLNPGDRKKKFDELLELQKYEVVRANAMQVINQFKKMEETHAQSLSQLDALLANQDLNELRLKSAQQKEKILRLRNEKIRLEEEVRLLNQKSLELEQKLATYLKGKEGLQKKESQREALHARVAKLVEQFPLEMKKNSTEIHAEKEKVFSLLSESLAKQELFRQKEAIQQKLSERLKLLEKRREELSKVLGEKSPELVEKELRDLLAKRTHAEGVRSTLQKSFRDLHAKLQVLAEKEKMLAEEEKSLESLHANCPTCKQQISPEHKIKLQFQIGGKKASLSNEIKEGQKDFVNGQSDLVETENLCKDFDKKILEAELKMSKAVELKTILFDVVSAENAIALCNAEIFQMGKPITLMDLERLQSRVHVLDQCLETHSLLEEEKVLLMQIEKEKWGLEGHAVTHEEVLSATRLFSEKQSYVSSLKKEMELEETIQAEWVERIRSIEQILGKRTEVHQRQARSRAIQESLSVFSNVLVETQEQLRETVVEAINAALEELWPSVYPYTDFVLAKILIQDTDYVLTVQEKNGDWISAESSLSGGERSAAALALRMAIAFVLTRQLSWIILDEPTHNLDAKSISMLSSMLRNRLPGLVDQVFVITHSLEIEKAATGSLYVLQREKNEDGITIPLSKKALLEVQ